ncbi:hypothetical protein [Stutzerimonas chloritidismutans]|nr:hypothetical protein [Stutzerimonas chloritidismutans]
MDFYERFQSILRAHTSDARRWSEMEALTGIPATSWNKAFHGKQRPTLEMLLAVARLWPDYAFWLMTGVTDAKHGHVSCRKAAAKSFYPERSFRRRKAARGYFLHLIEMFNRTYGDGDGFESDAEELEARAELALLELARDNEEQLLNNPTRLEELVKLYQAAKNELDSPAPTDEP